MINLAGRQGWACRQAYILSNRNKVTKLEILPFGREANLVTALRGILDRDLEVHENSDKIFQNPKTHL